MNSCTIRLTLVGALLLTASARGDLVHQWKFNGFATDSVGTAHGTLSGGAAITPDGRLGIGGGQMLSDPIGNTITEKTLVSWVSLNNLDTGRGGSALSLGHTGDKFDGIVYAEAEARKWMAGSNGFVRTQVPQLYGTEETVTEPGEVMMAIVYKADNSITLYRDGSLYGSYTPGSPLVSYNAGVDRALIGPRHVGPPPLDGFVNEARIYNSALGDAEIVSLFGAGPDLTPSDPPPPPPPPPAPMLLHQWTFNGDARDQVGMAHGALSGGALLEPDGRISLNGGQMLSRPIDQNIGAKTLVSWVSLNDLDAGRGGSALSLGHTAGLFDGIVYAEIEARKWMAGSNGFARTQNPQTFGTPETVTEPGEVMMAIVYDDQNGITLYRDGELYGNYTTSHVAQFTAGVDRALIGPRHIGTAVLDAFVNEARVYKNAMSATQIMELFQTGPSTTANPPPPPPPAPALAHLWSFEDGTANDSVGGAHGTLNNGATIVDGRLQLDGINDFMRSAPIGEAIEARTLMAWVSLDNLQQQAGSALTLERFEGDDVFDGIVFAERVAGQWMAGSNFFLRSVPDNGGAPETVTEPGEVMVAIVYDEDSSIRIYRDGELYAVASQGGLETYPAGVSDVLIGVRHEDISGGMGTVDGPDPFLAGFVNEARIYQGALSPDAIREAYNAGPIPEPSTVAIAGFAIAGAMIACRRRQKSRQIRDTTPE